MFYFAVDEQSRRNDQLERELYILKTKQHHPSDIIMDRNNKTSERTDLLKEMCLLSVSKCKTLKQNSLIIC